MDEAYRIAIASVTVFCAGAGGFLRWKITLEMPAAYRRSSHAWVFALLIVSGAVGIGQYRSIHTGIPVNYVTHAFALGAVALAVALFFTVRALPANAARASEREALSEPEERMQP